MNQLGFSMVQGMVLAGVLAGSGLVATKMLNEQKMVQKGIETRDQIEELNAMVFSALQDNETCTNTILQHGFKTEFNVGTGVKTLPLNYIQNKPGEFIIQKYDNTQSANENLMNRTYMAGNVQVRDIQLKFDTNTTTGLGAIEITYDRLQNGAAGSADDGKRLMKAGYGGKSIKKVLGIRVARNPVLPTKPFTSCYGVTLTKGTDSLSGSAETGNDDVARSVCEDMIRNVPALPGVIPAFKWDSSTSSCLPNSQCPDHQIYTGVSTTGEVKCRNLNEWVDFNSMIQPTSGTCAPPASARIEIIQTTPTVQVRIRCQ